MGILGKAIGSEFGKTSSDIALTIMLFMSVYLSIGLLANGVILLGVCFIVSVGILITALIGKQYVPSKIPIKLISVVFIWFTLVLTVLVQKEPSLSWFYVCGACAYLALEPKLANGVNGLGLLFLFYVLLDDSGIGAGVIELLPLFFVFGIMNYFNSQLNYLNGEVEGLHTVDSLTGCANRKSLQLEMEKAAGLRRRYQVNMSTVALKVKSKNSRTEIVGEKDFDKLLVELTQVWKSRLRNTDTLFRHSENMFISLLPSTSSDNAHLLAKDLIRASEAYEFSSAEKVSVSCKVVEHDGSEIWEDWYKKLIC